MRINQHYGVTIRGETSPVYVLRDSSGNSVSFQYNRDNPFERIKEAWLYIRVDNSLEGLDLASSTIKVWVNGYEFLTQALPDTINDNKYIKFDVAHLVQVPPHANSFSVVLYYNGNSQFIAYPQQSFLETTLYSPFDYLDKQHINSQDIGNFINFKQDIISFLPYISIPLFSNVLTYPFALVYDSFDCDASKFPLFPKGWKLNILEKLVDITTDSITLIDESFNQRKFIPSTDTSIFLDSSGSGLLIQMDGNDYKLFSPLTNGYKLFNQSGLIKKIKLVNDNEINITYNANSIVITDYRNNTVTVSNSSGLTITSSLLSSQTYTLNVNQGNLLTSLSFTSSLTSNTTLTHSFSYDEDDRLEIINSSDGYEGSFGFGIQYIYTFVLKYNSNWLSKYSLTNLVDKVETKNFINNVEYLYELDDNRNVIAKREKTPNMNSNDEFWFIDNFVSCTKNSLSLGEKIRLQLSLNSVDSFEYVKDFTVTEAEMYYISQYVFARPEQELDGGSYYFLVIKIEQDKAMPSIDGNYRDIKIMVANSYLIDDNAILNTDPIAYANHFGEKYITCAFRASSINNFFTFALLANFGYFKFSNAFVIKINNCLQGVLHGDTLSQYHSSPSTENVFSNLIKGITYTNPTNNKTYNVTPNDLKINSIARLKDGFTHYFFVDNLKNLIAFNSSGNTELKIYTDYSGTYSTIFFESSPFGFVSQDSNGYITLDEISSNGNYNDSYKVTTYRTRYSTTKNKYSIFDFYGNVLNGTDYRGAVSVNTYDSNKNLLSISTSKAGLPSIVSSNTYDTLNRLTSSTSRIGSQSSTIAYQYETGLDVVNQVTDGENHSRTLTFSPRYEYVKSVTEGSTTLTTNRGSGLNLYNYAISGGKFYFGFSSDRNELNKIIFASNGVTPVLSSGGSNAPSSNDSVDQEENRYDPFNPPSLPIQTDFLTITRTYSSDGTKTIQYVDSKPFTYYKVFNKYGRITRKYSGSSYNMTFTYDTNYSDGKLSQIVDTWGNESETTSLTYYNINLLHEYSVTGFMDYEKTISYNTYKRISSYIENFSNSSISNFNNTTILTNFNYDDYDDTLEQVSVTVTKNVVDITNVVQKIEKDDYGRMTSCLTTIATKSVGFDSVSYFSVSNQTSNEIASVTYKQGGTTSYTYDKVGNILSISSTNTNSQSVTYQYDSTYRLTKETHTSEGYYINYAYDAKGNITSAIKKDLSDNVISSDSFAYDSKYVNRMKKYNNVEIDYDDYWSPLTLNGATLTYYRGNLLSSYTKNSVTTNYKYNGFNLRTYKKVGNIVYRYILDGSRIVAERRTNTNSSSDKSYTIYLYGLSGVIGMIYNGDKYLYEKDIQGNVLAIYKKTLTSLTLQAKYSYDAYGNHQVLNPDGTVNTSSSFIGNINPFRYRSYYYDNETGFYYCQSRYYVPYLRRWLTIDDLSYLDNKNVYGCNLYAYCNDNPVMYKDESGHFVVSSWVVAGLIGAAIGATIGGLVGGLYAANNGANLTQILLSTLIGIITGAIAGFGSGAGGFLFSSALSATGASVSFLNGIFISKGAAIGIAFGMGGGLATIAGASNELFSQLLMEGKISDYKIILINGVVGFISGTIAVAITPCIPQSSSLFGELLTDSILSLIDEITWSNTASRFEELLTK